MAYLQEIPTAQDLAHRNRSFELAAPGNHHTSTYSSRFSPSQLFLHNLHLATASYTTSQEPLSRRPGCDGVHSPSQNVPLWQHAAVLTPAGLANERPNFATRGLNAVFLLNEMGIDPQQLMPSPRQNASRGQSDIVAIEIMKADENTASAPFHLNRQRTADKRKFECGICHKTFDRASRLKRCSNNHAGLKPHICGGCCGSRGCSKRYSSIEYLNRHLDSYSMCPFCERSHLKQNMARHLKSCRR